MCSHYVCTKMKAINSITLCWFVNRRNLLHCDMVALHKSENKLIKVKHFQKDTCQLPGLLWAAFSRSPIKPPGFVLLFCCDFLSSCPMTATCAIPSSPRYTFLEQLITLNSKSFSLFCSLLLCHLSVMSGMAGKQGFELRLSEELLLHHSLHGKCFCTKAWRSSGTSSCTKFRK